MGSHRGDGEASDCGFWVASGVVWMGVGDDVGRCVGGCGRVQGTLWEGKTVITGKIP